MTTPAPTSVCPKCGGALPAEAQQGLCPACALAAVAAPTEGDEASAHRGPPPALDVVAAAFPQLEILELIGQGGMGAVYRARQPRLDRPVALKLLSVAAGGGGTFAERFHREARLLAKLNHPGIVTVHDYGEAGGFFYLLMEYVDGVNLRQAMRAGRFTPAQALALVPKICEALQYAHDEGILHRDIKPENLLLDTRGRVKIADFGIAKLIGDKARDATITACGLAVGTPHYMAPEQLEHPQDVDQRADIYSLGVVCYEMLTGELPIGRFARPSQKTPVDPRVDDVVLRALEKERERRQSNATEVKTEVEQITGTPASAPRAPAPKTSLCYVSTPEHLRTLTGRFLYIYQGNGQLRLDERNLSFTSGWHNVTIPLASIRSLARGEYSFAAKPLPLHYIEVTFEDHGAGRTLLFTPTRSGLLPAWETNKDVAEWLSAIQTTVEKTTGQAMPSSRASGIGRSWSELVKSFALTALLCTPIFLAIPLIAEQRPPNRWTDYLPGPLVAAISFGLGLSLRAFMERRALTHRNLDCLTRLPGSSAAPGAGHHDTVSLDGAPAPAGNPPATPDQGHTRCLFSNPEPLRRCFPSATAPLFHCERELKLTADHPSRPAAAGGISWTAVASALCALPTWGIVMGLLFRLHASLGLDGLPPQLFLIGMWELITACAGVVALSLGARALREIRVSAGQVRGARLAIIGLLALPAGGLVKLGPQLLASAARGFGWQPTAEQGALFVGGTLIGILLLLAGAAWQLRRWVRRAAPRPGKDPGGKPEVRNPNQRPEPDGPRNPGT